MSGVRVWHRFHDFLFGPVDAIRLDSFRRLFALTLLAYKATWFRHAYEWLTVLGYHDSSRTHRLGAPNPAIPLPPSLVPVLGVILFGLILCVIFGWKPRLSSGLLVPLLIYMQYLDFRAAFTINKLYVVGFTVLALAPPVRSLPGTSGGPPLLVQSAWALRILQATLIVQYCNAGLCKAFHGDWLTHTDVLWTHVQGIYRTEIAAFALRVLPKWTWSVMMYSALSFEILAPVTFGIRRLRPLAYIWGASFQLCIALMMHQLILFSAQMVSFYVLFFDPETLRAIRAHVPGLRTPPAAPTGSAARIDATPS